MWYGRVLGGNLLILGLVLAVAEGLTSYLLLIRALMTTEDRSLEYIQYDPEIGWVTAPQKDLPDLEGPGMSVRTNAQGFRNTHAISLAVPGDKVRLLCSGDSFTFGYSVGNEHTWCQRLEALDPRFETVNMGVNGYGVDQAYLRYKRDGVKLEHDVHLLAFITDDFRRMQFDQNEGYAKPLITIEGGALTVTNIPVPHSTSLFSWITSNTANLRRLRTVEFLGSAWQKVGLRSADAHLPLEQERKNKTKAVLHQIFADLQRISAQRSITLVLVYFPLLGELGEAAPREWIAFIEEEARRLSLLFINVFHTFRSLPNDEAICLYRRNEHFSTQGNALAARVIYEQLLGEPVISRVLMRLKSHF